MWSKQKHTGHTRPDEQPDRRQTLTHRPDTAVARNHRIATNTNPVITKSDIEKIVCTGKLNRGITHVISLSHSVLITPEYIRDIKARLKEAKKADWYFYRRAYQNLKDQQYWLDQWNNSIDSNILLLLVELFLSLLFGGAVTIRNKPYPIAMNFGLPAPISDATWNMMSDDQLSVFIVAFLEGVLRDIEIIKGDGKNRLSYFNRDLDCSCASILKSYFPDDYALGDYLARYFLADRVTALHVFGGVQ